MPTRTRKREIDILRPAEVRRLLDQCSRRSPSGVRNRALVAILYGAGLRISEALALREKDLDLELLTATVHSGKGSKRRVVALFPDCAEIVQRWLDHRRLLRLSARHVVLCTLSSGMAGSTPTRPGRPLKREYVRVLLRRLAERAGLEKRVHAHGFRHSHADLLRRRGWDMEQIRRQLGHSSLKVTGDYLDHLGAHELPEKMREMAPVF